MWPMPAATGSGPSNSSTAADRGGHVAALFCGVGCDEGERAPGGRLAVVGVTSDRVDELGDVVTLEVRRIDVADELGTARVRGRPARSPSLSASRKIARSSCGT